MSTRDVDIVIARMRAVYPGIQVEQLRVTHPADDDGLWFLSHPSCPYEVQIESWNGQCPFLIETSEHNERRTAATVDEVIETVESWLRLGEPA